MSLLRCHFGSELCAHYACGRESRPSRHLAQTQPSPLSRLRLCCLVSLFLYLSLVLPRRCILLGFSIPAAGLLLQFGQILSICKTKQEDIKRRDEKHKREEGRSAATFWITIECGESIQTVGGSPLVAFFPVFNN